MGRVPSFVRNSLLACLAVFATILSPAGDGDRAAAQGQPNILVILTDDQRFDTMGVMPRTLRWFGQEGVQFPDAYVTTPLCCPSRASIMTGRFVHNHKVRNNYEAPTLDQRQTVQRYLHDAGYFTAISGKYLNFWDLPVNPPHFDRWSIQNHGYRKRLQNTDGVVKRQRKYSTDFIRQQAIRFLQAFEQDDARPWLMFVTPFAPHHPFHPAHRHRKLKVPTWAPSPSVGEGDRTDKPPSVQGRTYPVELAVLDRRQQLRSLVAVDQMVKQVMTEVERLGEGGDTLAFFVSDNGFFWSEHGLVDKRFPYTEAIRVPMFMRWPGHLPGGATDGRMAQLVDVPATIMQAAGITPDPEYPVDGRSLLSGFSRDRILVEHYIDPLSPDIIDWASIRTPTYQYVEYYDQTAQESVAYREYYDLVSDPWQLTNLLGDGNPGNDPPEDRLIQLGIQLSQDRRCEGTEGVTACP
jgi:arylsulfatase A-like enzyme